MLRPALVALTAIALLGACRPAADAELVGSPGSSAAGTEAASDRIASRTNPGSATAGSGLARSLVAVASVNAGDAQPCERVCGNIGDCLLADAAYTATSAGGLELECLDMCVHSPDADRAKVEFLACGSKDECGQLIDCAEQHWTALAEIRKSPVVAGITSSGDPCKTGCRWFYACFYTGQPPGEAYLEPHLERALEECVAACDTIQMNEREFWGHFASCLPEHCGDRPDLCWDNRYTY